MLLIPLEINSNTSISSIEFGARWQRWHAVSREFGARWQTWHSADRMVANEITWVFQLHSMMKWSHPNVVFVRFYQLTTTLKCFLTTTCIPWPSSITMCHLASNHQLCHFTFPQLLTSCWTSLPSLTFPYFSNWAISHLTIIKASQHHFIFHLIYHNYLYTYNMIFFILKILNFLHLKILLYDH